MEMLSPRVMLTKACPQGGHLLYSAKITSWSEFPVTVASCCQAAVIGLSV